MTQNHNIRNIKNEIEELLDIPEIATYFSEVLRHVKQKYKKQISQYDHLRKFKKSHKKGTDEFVEEWPKGKTSFFDLAGVEYLNGVRWDSVKVKSEGNRAIVEMIIAIFRKKIDKYEVNSNLIQSEIIELPKLDKSFRIGFIKKSNTQVIGFIKEHEGEKDTVDYVIRDDSNILIITQKYKNLKKKEMYTQIKQLMKDYPDLIEDIFFYSHMVLNPGGGSRGTLE